VVPNYCISVRFLDCFVFMIPRKGSEVSFRCFRIDLTVCGTFVPLKTGLSTTLRCGTFIRLKRTQYDTAVRYIRPIENGTQYDIAMSDCHVSRREYGTTGCTPRNRSTWFSVDCQRQIVLRLAAIPTRNKVNY
jgi:hypothetical protein